MPDLKIVVEKVNESQSKHPVALGRSVADMYFSDAVDDIVARTLECIAPKQGDFKRFDRVKYIPAHAQGNEDHQDCEIGTVSSSGDVGLVFVKFDNDIWGTDWSDAQSKGCERSSLKLLARDEHYAELLSILVDMGDES